MNFLRKLLVLIVTTAIALFVIQNLTAQRVLFLVYEFNVPLAVPVLAAFLLGGLTGPQLVRLVRRIRADRLAERAKLPPTGRHADSTER